MMDYRCFPVGELQANCWLVWDETRQAVLIDPGDEASRLLRALQEEQLTLTAIFLTHAHFDHMMAAPALQEATGAPLYVHKADAPALTDGSLSLADWVGRPCRLYADHVLSEGDTVTVGHTAFTVYHTPGHTPGSCCYATETALFTGDTLFAGSVGRTDFPGGSFVTLRESLRRLAQLPETLSVLPGHNEPTTLERELAVNPYLIGC